MSLPSVLSTILPGLAAHAVWWGPALGAAAALEALVVVGAVVPVTPVLLWLGAAAASGGVTPWLLAWAVGGAALGNAASYEFGRRLGPSALQRSRALARAHALAAPVLASRGGAAIVLSRLIGGAAGLVSFAAGFARLPRRAFYVKSLVANLLWVVTMAAIGYAGAAGWRALAARAGLAGPAVVLALALLLAAAWRLCQPASAPPRGQAVAPIEGASP